MRETQPTNIMKNSIIPFKSKVSSFSKITDLFILKQKKQPTIHKGTLIRNKNCHPHNFKIIPPKEGPKIGPKLIANIMKEFNFIFCLLDCKPANPRQFACNNAAPIPCPHLDKIS